MDSREFDDLIKDSLDGFSQLPEKEVKKVIFGKLFYQNLWVFHKMKLLASIVIIGGGSALTYLYLEDIKSTDYYQTHEDENNNDLLVDDLSNSESSETLNTTEIQSSDNKTDKYVADIQKDQVNEKVSISNNSNSLPDQHDDFDNISENTQDNKLTNITDKKEVVKSDKDIADINDIRSKVELDNDQNDDKGIKVSEFSSEESNVETDKSVLHPVDRVKAKILDKVNSLNIVALHTCAPLNEIVDVPAPDLSDYANEHKRGFTLDAYFSPYNRTDVDNVLDPLYHNYWWDFYKEHEMEKSGLGGGVNLSYNFKNFKVNSGFNFDQVYDYKPDYEYFTDQDSIFAIFNGNIILLNVELISGLQVLGPADSSGIIPLVITDTTVVFYVDPNDDNLLNEIAESSNRYNYLRIPLTLGYEFSFKRASFEVNAGVEYTRLMKASGISYKNGYVDVGIRPIPYYYYENMVATTYQNNMSSIRINNWNYVANAIVRVRLTRSLDLFSSFRFQYNTNNIMGDDYLLQKTYKKYGLNFGITYHLNPRLALKETITPSFE